MSSKRFLITGASRGLGHALATMLLERGDKVGVNYLKSDGPPAELASRFPGFAFPLQADIRDEAATQKMLDTFCAEAGGIDVLVNNAAVYYGSLLIKKMPADIRAEVETNFVGSVLVTRAVIPVMLRQRCGLIVSISSVAAVQPRPGLATYAASKSALEVFTRGIALEYRRKNIRALSVRFGPISTDMFSNLAPQERDLILSRVANGRPLSKQEAASALLTVIDNCSSSQTGTTTTIDDGYLLGM